MKLEIHCFYSKTHLIALHVCMHLHQLELFLNMIGKLVLHGNTQHCNKLSNQTGIMSYSHQYFKICAEVAQIKDNDGINYNGFSSKILCLPYS